MRGYREFTTSMTINVGFQYVEGADTGLPTPAKSSLGAAGFDLRADLLREVPNECPIVIPPGDWAVVPTGLRLEIPENMEGQVRSRSGLAVKHGVTVLNSPGTIDSDYRGELKVVLINAGKKDFFVCHGDRIAQLVVVKLPNVQFVKIEKLAESQRGDKGFGSSGID